MPVSAVDGTMLTAIFQYWLGFILTPVLLQDLISKGKGKTLPPYGVTN